MPIVEVYRRLFRLPVIEGTQNTGCAIYFIQMKAFLNTNCCIIVGKTIITDCIIDNINNQTFKLPRLDDVDLHRKFLLNLTFKEVGHTFKNI